MKTFLQYVAEDVLMKYGSKLQRLAMVFPNKRASLFFSEALLELKEPPMWAPSYMTINELFASKSPLVKADDIKLVSLLHKTYIKVTGKNESLDHFYQWGQLLLSDFDDLDKNMANAGQVFSNLKNLKELDDISYLTDEQREVLKRFFNNFTDDQDSLLKRKFLEIWSRLFDIYTAYKQTLREENLGYEGMIFRDAIERGSTDYDSELYLFVGFNYTTKVEERLFGLLKDEGKAKFYWDFSHDYLSIKGETHHEAGKFIAQHIKRFPNELDSGSEEIYGGSLKTKRVTFISATTENIQSRYIAQWLKDTDRITDDKLTAVVLCNEDLLPDVIHSLPKEAKSVNITAGYNLSLSPIASLLRRLTDLIMNGYGKNSKSLRLKYLSPVLSHPYMHYIIEGSEQLARRLSRERKYYIDQATLQDLHLDLFQQLPTEKTSMLQWLKDIVERLAIKTKGKQDIFLSESLFATYRLLNRLLGLAEAGDLEMDMSTLERLIAILLRGIKIPFHGEPAMGTQIMGVLETRNLDFKHILMLSCSEDFMPRGVNDTSFIPYSIRKAYGLTTVDNKVAIYSYYFHRLMQRGEDITIVYNDSKQDGKKGGMSQFMIQMLVESGLKVERRTLKAEQSLLKTEPAKVEKTEQMVRILEKKDYISPTSINNYQACPLRYFYEQVAKIKQPDNDDDTGMEQRMFGNIFHEAAQRLYQHIAQKGTVITKETLQKALDDKSFVERIVDEACMFQLFNIDLLKRSPQKVNNPLPPYNGMQLIVRKVIIRLIQKLLRLDMEICPFRILGTEETIKDTFILGEEAGSRTITVGGKVDRLDEVTDPKTKRRYIRVVDYKTGSSDVNSGRNKPQDVGDIFSKNSVVNHKDYYLQTLLYCALVRHNKEWNPDSLPVVPALLFIQRAKTGQQYNPILQIGGEPITDIVDYDYELRMEIRQILERIFSLEIPFSGNPTEDNCRYCPYHLICGLQQSGTPEADD